MFDTMTMTKAIGAVCGSLLIFLFSVWAADVLFATGSGGGHGGEAAEQAYMIDTGAEATTETTEAGPDFMTVYATADVAAGEKTFTKCKACHKIDGADGTGPHLNGVVDRAKASVAGFPYSEPILALTAEAWTPENLNAFLTNPKGNLPGTKMTFPGLPKVEDRANVIAYLASLK